MVYDNLGWNLQKRKIGLKFNMFSFFGYQKMGYRISNVNKLIDHRDFVHFMGNPSNSYN